MTDRFDRPAPWMPWALTSLVLLLVAGLAYTFGAHQQAVGAAGEAARGWQGGPFPGIFMLFLFIWFFGGLRRLWWGGCGPWGYRRFSGPGWRDARDEWSDWHRREHERMRQAEDASRSSGGPGAV